MSIFFKEHEKQRMWTGFLHLLIAVGAGIGSFMLAVKTYFLCETWL